MASIGILSIYSSYNATASSIYGSIQAAPLANLQETSDVENPVEDLSINGDINDEAIISEKAKSMSAMEKSDTQSNMGDSKDNQTKNAPKSSTSSTSKDLTTEQQQQVATLKARDAQVKAHEQAHLAAASGIGTSAPSYTYQTGPDGKKYAVGGEVAISVTESEDPQTNIKNAQIMKAAALAPVDPSSQDKSVAQHAEAIIAKAKQQIADSQAESLALTDEESETSGEAKADKSKVNNKNPELNESSTNPAQEDDTGKDSKTLELNLA